MVSDKLAVNAFKDFFDGFTMSFPLNFRKVQPSISNPSSMWVMSVFSSDSSRPLVFRKSRISSLDKKELSYLIYRLTRKEICNEKNEDTNTTRDFYKKVKAFFNVKKEAWKDNDNISDMVRKISDDKQKEILKLLKEALETN